MAKRRQILTTASIFEEFTRAPTVGSICQWETMLPAKFWPRRNQEEEKTGASSDCWITLWRRLPMPWRTQGYGFQGFEMPLH